MIFGWIPTKMEGSGQVDEEVGKLMKWVLCYSKYVLSTWTCNPHGKQNANDNWRHPNSTKNNKDAFDPHFLRKVFGSSAFVSGTQRWDDINRLVQGFSQTGVTPRNLVFPLCSLHGSLWTLEQPIDFYCCDDFRVKVMSLYPFFPEAAFSADLPWLRWPW